MRTLFPLKLYTTSSCHLCDEAHEMLLQLELTQKLTLVEISENDVLLSSYGIRIPVLQRLDNGDELNWPFTKNDVVQFVSR